MATNQNHRFELISLDICPYVQRSVITLLHKKVGFKLTFIDLDKPPEWFERISPLGKVPVLLVRDLAGAEPIALFESAVINEYIDEITPPALAFKDPLRKARERAWIEVSSELMMLLRPMFFSSDRKELAEAEEELWQMLARVEEALPGGSTFRGEDFSLVDAAFAPLFMRLLMIRGLRDSRRWSGLAKTREWANALLARPEVRDSVVPEFREKLAHFLKSHGSPSAGELVDF
jgi:glutathione S-transferase